MAPHLPVVLFSIFLLVALAPRPALAQAGEDDFDPAALQACRAATARTPSAAAASSPNPGWPRQLRDALGRAVTIAAPPQRIITVFSSNTELVAYLGLAERIAGVEQYTRFPASVLDRPRIGGRLGFSVDAVVALAPDLVIVTPARQAAHQLVDPMERVGIPVVVLLSRSVGEVLDNLRLIGLATGVEATASCLAGQWEARLQRLAASQVGRTPPSVVLITGGLGNGMLLVARPRSYTFEAIERAGGRHALPDPGPVAQVSPEAVLAADPDVLLFAGTQAGLDELIQLPGWRDLRAVRQGRALTVSRSKFLIPGPRTIDGIEGLARVLARQMSHLDEDSSMKATR